MSIEILCDSTYAVNATTGIFTPSDHRQLVHANRSMMDRIQKQRAIQVKWVKAHNGNPGNELADLGATLSLRGIHNLPRQQGTQHKPITQRTVENMSIDLTTDHACSSLQTIIDMDEAHEKLQSLPENVLRMLGKDTRALLDVIKTYACVHSSNTMQTIAAYVRSDCIADLHHIMSTKWQWAMDDKGPVYEATYREICQCRGEVERIAKHSIARVAEFVVWMDDLQAQIGKAIPMPEVRSRLKVRPSAPVQITTSDDPTNGRARQQCIASRSSSSTRPAGPGQQTLAPYKDARGRACINITVINVCAGTGITDLVVTTVLDQLRSDGIECNLHKVHRFENDAMALKMASSLMEQSHKDLATEEGAVDEEKERNIVANISSDQIILRMSGTPCQSMSRGIMYKHAGATVGPHASPSNLMWQDLKNTCNIVMMGAKLVSIKEQVQPAVETWKDELDDALGFCTQQDGANYDGCATRERLYYVSPKWPQSIDKTPRTRYVLHRARNTVEFIIKGIAYKWEGGPTAEKCPPTIKAIYPEILARHADPQRTQPLEKGERSYLQKMQLHSRRGEVVYAGPLQLAVWLGLTSFQAEAACKPFPCMDEIDDVCGQPRTFFSGRPLPQDIVFRPCQHLRLCHNCSEAAKLLGTAWCLPSACEVVYKTLCGAIMSMQDSAARTTWQGFPFYQPHLVHRCGPHCPEVQNKGQVDKLTQRHPKRKTM